MKMLDHPNIVKLYEVNIHTHIYTCIHIYLHIYTHILKLWICCIIQIFSSYMRSYIDITMYTCMYIYSIHVYTYAYMHTYIRTHQTYKEEDKLHLVLELCEGFDFLMKSYIYIYIYIYIYTYVYSYTSDLRGGRQIASCAWAMWGIFHPMKSYIYIYIYIYINIPMSVCM
jgi:hypothetical protein